MWQWRHYFIQMIPYLFNHYGIFNTGNYPNCTPTLFTGLNIYTEQNIRNANAQTGDIKKAATSLNEADLIYGETENTLGQARYLKQLCITFKRSDESQYLVQTGEQYLELVQQLNKSAEIQSIQNLTNQLKAEKEN